jgi:hypothetical protein
MLEIMARYADAVGIVGVILTLIAYYYINVGKFTSENMTYLVLNLIGSSMLMFSLCFSWNLSSVLIEIAWMTISVIGIVRSFRLRAENAV